MNKVFVRNKQTTIVFILAELVCVAWSIFCFCFSGTIHSVFRRILMYFCGSFMAVIAILILCYIYLSRDNEANYFLFDKRLHKNIPVDKLNFDLINSKMDLFLLSLSDDSSSDKNDIFWRTNCLERNVQAHNFGYRNSFRPLVAYKMLYDLAETDKQETWFCFIRADKSAIRFVCDSLEQNGESEMSKAIRYFYENISQKKVRDFLTSNKKYIQGKMLSYVRRNMEMFY